MNQSFKIEIKAQSAIAIALYIQEKYKINDSIKLQKLLFFLTLESLKLRDKPLFSESFEAWVYGPVVPEVYYYFHSSESNTNSSIKLNFIKKVEEKELKNFIDNNIQKYFIFSTLELRDWAHKLTPWIMSRSGYDEKERSRKKIKLSQLRIFAQSNEFEWNNYHNQKKD